MSQPPIRPHDECYCNKSKVVVDVKEVETEEVLANEEAQDEFQEPIGDDLFGEAREGEVVEEIEEIGDDDILSKPDLPAREPCAAAFLARQVEAAGG